MNRNVISDLSYRGYSGPMAPPHNRWKVIARSGIRSAMTNKAFWVLTTISAWYYMLIMAIIFFLERLTEEGIPEQATNPFFANVNWSAQVIHGYTYGSLFWLTLALLLGARSIASDNKANALLVYLSKPTNKRDYLLGKWMGLFIPLLIAMLLPTLLFFFNGALNYRPYGFISHDPFMIVKAVIAIAFSAAFYTSLTIGISSLFNNARNAGATLAGLYFLTAFFNILVMIALDHLNSVRANVPAILEWLSYASISGMPFALLKGVFDNPANNQFGQPNPGMVIQAPQPLLTILVMGLVALAALAIARKRIRAVEVVK